MRKLIFLIIILLFFQFSCSPQKIYLDETGEIVKEREFLKKWRENDSIARWDSISPDSNQKIHKLNKCQYQAKNLDFKQVIAELQKITKQDIPPNRPILLNYGNYDDFCSHNPKNYYSANDLTKSRNDSKDLLKILSAYRITYYLIFDKKIVLENNSSSLNEYNFSDNNNYFKKNIFDCPALCGSSAIIKPNGETLIYNGEKVIGTYIDLLTYKDWNKFFPREEEE